MKRIIILAFLLASTWAYAQELDKYWVQFRDKSAPSPYTMDNPSAYLSPKALERRQRQRIQIDSLDLPICPQYIAALQEAGIRVQNRSKWLNGVTVFMPQGSDPSILDEFDFVLSYEWVEQLDSARPDIPTGVPTWGNIERQNYMPYSRNYYNYAYTQIKQLNGIKLHKAGYEGQGITIGVCDGGFPGIDTVGKYEHLRAEGRLLATRDFVWDGDNVFNVHDHGTVVLSTMAAYDPGLYVGTAPKASYILCRTENTTVESLLEEYNWIAAAEYLDSMGADIITTSLGYFYFDDANHNHTLEDLDGNTTPMAKAANIAASRGMVVINAAGNDGQADPQHLGTPADAPWVLTVGACTKEDDWAPFSSHGPTYDLRIKPDVVALGSAVKCVNSEGFITTTNGTSLATPILAGMVACLWQRLPHLTATQICDSLRTWGDMANAPSIYTGYGIPDFGRALLDDTPANNVLSPTLQQLVIYPNPAMAGSNIQLQSTMPITQLHVCDLMGRMMNMINLNEPTNNVALPSLPAGIYYLRAIGQNGTLTTRLVVTQ